MSVSAAGSVEESPTRRSVELERSGSFGNLRGVQWRINLGILPSSYSSIDDLRKVTAESRRRYAELRRCLLVDPHWRKDGTNSPDPVMDNPLSQNPDSTWGRFFRNAELEKMVDQDLSRLYPEHESYFQTPGCQGMLRRILLLWCLRHPEFGYRQGMHELLAPLLYVLHVDIERLSQVRKEYEDHFTDKFDGFSLHENDLTYNFDLKKFLDSMEDEIGHQGNSVKVRSLDELDPEIQTIVRLSDAYGAEGELGIVLSEKFKEHDAYCMFDALMGGANGSVSMADFFAHSHADGSLTGLPPVIEASAAMYHLLSVVDSSLHSHLVELGVEPQYFGLRWLRVLFVREFSLGDLLIIWDEIFASDNSKSNKDAKNDTGSGFGILSSPRGALIAAMAVSMMLYIRSSLLATENATTCLQRLLNFPENVNLNKIIRKAKSLGTLALDASISSSCPPFDGVYNRSNLMVVRGLSLPTEPISPRTPLTVVPESYWEEKWRDLHKAEELRQDSLVKQNPIGKKGWSEKVKLRLSRAESDPTPRKVNKDKKEHRSSVRRGLLEDLSKELGFEEEIEKAGCFEVSTHNDHPSVEAEVQRQDSVNRDFACTSDDRYLTGNAGSDENFSIFSDPASPVSGANDNENESEKSSIASNSSVDENDSQSQTLTRSPSLPVSHSPDSDDILQDSHGNNDSLEKPPTMRKVLSGKFQWFRKLGRNNAGEETSEKVGGSIETKKSSDNEGNRINSKHASIDDGSCKSTSSSKGETVDQNVMLTLKNLGQSMLEHIQVVESVFLQERGQVGSLDNFAKNVLVGKRQDTAVTALKELRKISSLLSEM